MLLVAALAFGGFGRWGYAMVFPKGSTEVVQLTPAKRLVLQSLRAETKFQPNDYPPLGYTGAESAQDRARGTAAVNGFIDAVLAQPDGPVHAEAVSALIDPVLQQVDLLDTEDRERTYGYVLEVWYILGFKGATGHFDAGSAFRKPEGYAEPLPPGWQAPDKPRPIGQ
ncbi:MAG TPA: hypothetical protein VKX28_16045 [Xanthobacteraceae bacterium]|nr:hypothetical protein [Xanthobacteraceae bacterium]